MDGSDHFPSPARLVPALAALLLALLLVVGSALHAQRTVAELSDMTAARARTWALLLDAERALSLFKDVETGSRGFVLTGDERYLDPYLAARAALPERYAALRAAAGETWAADLDWPGLDAAVEQRLQLAARLVDSRRQQGREALDDPALLAGGKASMDVVRARIGEIEARVAARLAEIDAALAVLRAESRRAGGLAAVLVVALVLVATAVLLRERQLRIRLETALRDSNRTLDARVQARTAELAAARDRIAGFAAELERSIEGERQRLSREVHDQIGQVFTAIRMILRGLPAGSLPADQAAVLEQAVDMGVTTARRIAAELRPPLLDDLGLQAALAHLAERLFGPAGIDCEVTLAGSEVLNLAQSLAIYRIVQEACSNVLRHAAARRLVIQGEAAGETYRIVVCDDGRGLPDGTPRPGGLGILGMQERAALLGGRVRVERATGGGVSVCIEMPLARGGSGDGHESPVA